MVRFIKVLAIVAATALTIPALASAQVTVNNTGPGSSVTVTDNSECTINVENVTNIAIDNSNDQNTDSGDATTNNNSDGGDANTGSSSSSNSVTVDFSVTNGTAGTNASGDECVFETASAPTEVPVDGGNGGGDAGGGEVNSATTTNGGGQGAAVAALPATGIEDVLPAIALAAGIVATIAVVSKTALRVSSFKK